MNLYKALANFLGYELINRGGNPSLGFHIIDLVKLRGVDLVLDIGGNMGQFTKSLRQDGYQGEVHSFEPVKSTFVQLQQASDQDPKWFVHNFAMGDILGQKEVNVTVSSDFASFLQPNEYGMKRFKKNNTGYTEIV